MDIAKINKLAKIGHSNESISSMLGYNIKDVEAIINQENKTLNVPRGTIIDNKTNNDIKVDKELDDIVQEAIDDILNSDEVDNLKSNKCEYRQELLDVKSILIEMKKQDYDTSIEILKETHYIKKNIAQHNKLTYGLMFLAGTAFGMADAKWMPYASLIYEFGKQVLVAKG